MNPQSYLPHGKVYLVGAGPGDPELITVKGSRILGSAEVIVYDRLANPELLSLTSEQSEHIYVGKRPGKPSVAQEQINRILITKAKEGKSVARLKGGDSFVFGRGGEECLALKAADISYEVIPGISSALAAPAYAGIPVTHRKVARSFTVVTGHTIKKSDSFENWDHLANADTLVILMGMRNLEAISQRLISFGRRADTPVAVIQQATYGDQQTVLGTLQNISEKASHLASPATIVVGELANMNSRLSWFGVTSTEISESTGEKVLSNFAG